MLCTAVTWRRRRRRTTSTRESSRTRRRWLNVDVAAVSERCVSLSLPHPTSGSTLRMLIESRVQLPTWRRDTSTSSDRRDFFLDIVRDVSCELDLARLTRKMLANLATLASAESTSIYMMDTASRTWSAGDVVRWRGQVTWSAGDVVSRWCGQQVAWLGDVVSRWAWTYCSTHCAIIRRSCWTQRRSAIFTDYRRRVDVDDTLGSRTPHTTRYWFLDHVPLVLRRVKSSWGHGHLTSRVTGSSTTSHWSFDITTSHWFLDPTGPSTSPRVTVSSTPLVLRHHHESLVHRPHWSFDITTRYWFLDHVPLVLQHHHESLVPRPHWSFDITTRYWFLDHVPLVLRHHHESLVPRPRPTGSSTCEVVLGSRTGRLCCWDRHRRATVWQCPQDGHYNFFDLYCLSVIRENKVKTLIGQELGRYIEDASIKYQRFSRHHEHYYHCNYHHRITQDTAQTTRKTTLRIRVTGRNTTGPPSRDALWWVTLHMRRHKVFQTTDGSEQNSTVLSTDTMCV